MYRVCEFTEKKSPASVAFQVGVIYVYVYIDR